MKDLAGKVSVITGAGRGIGRGIALHCASEGMKVVLAGIRVESLTKTAADLRALGAETLIVQADVSLSEDVENLAEKSCGAFGAVDLLVNNAGVTVQASILESSMDDWNWVMGVNFFGVLHGLRAFIPRMQKRDATSHVVNVSSLAGVVEAGGVYGVSKHAVVALTEALYHNLADHAPQIKVSVFCPGYVNTEFYRVNDARSERFKTDATLDTDENVAERREIFNKYGFSIEEAARILFEGLEKEKLYIGPEAFQKQFPRVSDRIRDRAENIANERNPEHPWDPGPLNPV